MCLPNLGVLLGSSLYTPPPSGNHFSGICRIPPESDPSQPWTTTSLAQAPSVLSRIIATPPNCSQVFTYFAAHSQYSSQSDSFNLRTDHITHLFKALPWLPISIWENPKWLYMAYICHMAWHGPATCHLAGLPLFCLSLLSLEYAKHSPARKSLWHLLFFLPSTLSSSHDYSSPCTSFRSLLMVRPAFCSSPLLCFIFLLSMYYHLPYFTFTCSFIYFLYPVPRI